MVRYGYGEWSFVLIYTIVLGLFVALLPFRRNSLNVRVSKGIYLSFIVAFFTDNHLRFDEAFIFMGKVFSEDPSYSLKVSSLRFSPGVAAHLTSFIIFEELVGFFFR